MMGDRSWAKEIRAGYEFESEIDKKLILIYAPAGRPSLSFLGLIAMRRSEYMLIPFVERAPIFA
jgi:hypothetical protein